MCSCIGGKSKKMQQKVAAESQPELLSRTALETHKLDLMAEISAVKLKLATSEKDRRELEEKLLHAQKRIDELQSRLNDRTIEVTELRARVAKNGTVPSAEQADHEVEKLKKAVESLMASNDEKDRHIDEMRRMMKKYKRIEEMVLSSQGKKGLEYFGLEDDRSDTSSTQNSSSSAEITLRDNQQLMERLEIVEPGDHPRGHMPNPSATSTPVNSYHSEGKPPMPNNSGMSPPSAIHLGMTPTPRKPPSGMNRSNSCEDLSPSSSKTPPSVRKRGEGYANTETDEETVKDEMAQQYKAIQTGGSVLREDKKKQKGIKRFFGKLRRSSSQDLEGEYTEDFKRSGLRATAGARLGWSKDIKNQEMDVPFARWDSDRVASWMHSIGLSMYVGECKRWLKNGDQLLKATPHDLEKELGIRNQFHKKKLQLALQAIGSDSHDRKDELDHNWVTRWLDDIGLPQYKDYFSDARIDGRMLHYLTVDDLVALKVNNTLHHLSIKRGIQVLRLNNFDPTMLKRRPTPDEEGKLENMPHDVMLWTNHRVMEWLRTIDLSEYAPNLRGSGVHGALMVLEPRFGAELFAAILSIPPNKTLLRRHLTTHFVTLIGNDMQHRKREVEMQPGHTPLTPNQKIKLKKFGLFSHRRTKSEPDFDDYVCPMEGQDMPPRRSPEKHTNGGPVYPKENKKTVKEINSYSHEINSLTHMLARDQFLDDVPTSNV